MPSEVTRYVPRGVESMLWGRAAGLCEFRGCNSPLWKSRVTQEQVNIAQKAHIYAFSSDGPRGNEGIPKEHLNTLANLMLVCHSCHELIDNKKDGGRYTAAILQKMKIEHEQRIERKTRIAPEMQSHVILYGANIANHSSPLNYDAAAVALTERYPAEDHPIELGMANGAFVDHDPKFWEIEAQHLQTLFSRSVGERLRSGDIKHVSVFAIAPQPLLVLLGSLLSDITPAEVYQRHREPPSWSWPDAGESPQLKVTEPRRTDGIPALILSLSATITEDRITSVLGPDVAIWTVTIPTPHNDSMKSRHQLAEYRTAIRQLLNRIKERHGQTTPLHIFPAVSVSAAVELGRTRMPKADMPWRLYDQVNARGGFIYALSIPQ